MDNLCAKVTLAQLIRWEAMEPGNAIQFVQGLPGGDPEGGLSGEKIQLAVRHWGRGMVRSGPRTGRAAIDTLVADERSLEEHHWDQLWTGGDLNQNYKLDPWEVRWRDQLPPWQRGTGRSSQTSMPTQQSGIPALQPGGAQLPHPQGWQQWIAEFSGCRNIRRDGQQRIPINHPDLLRMHQDLIQIWPAPWASYLVAYRQYGGRPVSDNPSRPQGATGSESTDYVPDFSVAAQTIIASPLDLIDSEVTIPSQSGEAPRRLTSPIQSNGPEFAEQLDRLVDDVWFEDVEYREGVIDTLEAPSEATASLVAMADLPKRYLSSPSGRVPRCDDADCAEGILAGWPARFGRQYSRPVAWGMGRRLVDRRIGSRRSIPHIQWKQRDRAEGRAIEDAKLDGEDDPQFVDWQGQA